MKYFTFVSSNDIPLKTVPGVTDFYSLLSAIQVERLVFGNEFSLFETSKGNC